MVKFTVSLILLSSIHLFVCFPNNLNYCCQQMRGAYKMCTVAYEMGTGTYKLCTGAYKMCTGTLKMCTGTYEMCTGT